MKILNKTLQKILKHQGVFKKKLEKNSVQVHDSGILYLTDENAGKDCSLNYSSLLFAIEQFLAEKRLAKRIVSIMNIFFHGAI